MGGPLFIIGTVFMIPGLLTQYSPFRRSNFLEVEDRNTNVSVYLNSNIWRKLTKGFSKGGERRVQGSKSGKDQRLSAHPMGLLDFIRKREICDDHAVFPSYKLWVRSSSTHKDLQGSITCALKITKKILDNT